MKDFQTRQIVKALKEMNKSRRRHERLPTSPHKVKRLIKDARAIEKNGKVSLKLGEKYQRECFDKVKQLTNPDTQRGRRASRLYTGVCILLDSLTKGGKEAEAKAALR